MSLDSLDRLGPAAEKTRQASRPENKSKHSHPAASLVPVSQVALELGLKIDGPRASCVNKNRHAGGVDRHPSMHLCDNHVHCFSCGFHADAIELVRRVKDLGFREAVSWLERLARLGGGHFQGSTNRGVVAIPDAMVLDVFAKLEALSVPPTVVSPAGRYLVSRGILSDFAASRRVRELLRPNGVFGSLRNQFGEEALAAAGLVSRAGGFLFARHTLLFFYAECGQTVFVQARDVTGQSCVKELCPKNVKCPVPYNHDILLDRPEEIAICEGCIDTLSGLQLGLQAIGVPGVNGFREEWFELFQNKPNVRIVFDADEAGRAGGAKLRDEFRRRGFRAKSDRPSVGKDLNDLLIARSKENTNE